MLKLIFLTLAMACLATAQLIPVVTSWQQLNNDAKYALAYHDLSLYNSAQSQFVAIGGVNNTANGQGYTYVNGTLVPYSTTDDYSNPNHVYLFLAYRDDNNAPGMVLTTWYPSALDNLGYYGNTANHGSGNKVVVIGGASQINGSYSYPNSTRSFTFSVYIDEDDMSKNNVSFTASPLPTAQIFGHSAVSFGSDTTITVFGGAVTTNDTVQLLNTVGVLLIANKTWTYPNVTGTIPAPRAWHSATYYNSSHMLVFGGDDGANYFNDVFLYDNNNKRWSTVNTTVARIPSGSVSSIYGNNAPPGTLQNNFFTPTIRGRSGHQGEIITPKTSNKRYYICFGGNLGNDTFTNEILALDLSTWTWYVIPTPNAAASARANHATITMDAYTMLIWGGLSTNQTVLGSIYSVAFTAAAAPMADDPTPSAGVAVAFSTVSALILAVLSLLF